MDGWQRRAIHFPTQKHFICLDLAPWNTNDIVHRLVILEVGVRTIELQMLSRLLEAAASFDDFLQADTKILGVANGAFCPWRLWHFVTLAGVEADLFDSPGSGALHGDHFPNPLKFRLIFEVFQREALWVIHQAVYIKAEVGFFD